MQLVTRDCSLDLVIYNFVSNKVDRIKTKTEINTNTSPNPNRHVLLFSRIIIIRISAQAPTIYQSIVVILMQPCFDKT
jgi:hypothetical protein